MANHVSALKRMRIIKRRTEINRERKSRLRHSVRALRRMMDSQDPAGVLAALPKTFSIIDRSAKWGIIKTNTAARYKSRIALRLKKLTATAA